MPAVFFTADYGGVPILISQIETERGRDLAVLSPEQGDDHSFEDKGRRVRRASCEILFVDQPGLDAYTDRYDRFLALAESETPQVFTHPLDGSYRARVEGLSVSAASDALAIRVSCTFVRDTPPSSVVGVAPGTTPAAGVEAVATAADAVSAELEQLGLASDVPSAVAAGVTSWDETEDLDSAQVFIEVATLAGAIDAMIDALDLARDLDRWTAYKAAILMRDTLARAAESYTSEVDQIVDLYVDVGRPVIAIAAEVYGGELAQERAAQIVKLNRIRTPGRVQPGTTLKIPRPST